MREIFGYAGGEKQYEPPALFRDIRRYQGDTQFQYICDELLRLKAEGTLYATDLLSQPSYTRDMIGLTLTGQTVDPESLRHVRAAVPLPDEVVTHKINVRCCEGSLAATVKYKRAVVPAPMAKGLGAKLSVSRDGENYRRVVAQNVDKWVDWESTEATMSLPEAWVCLSQHGRYCRPARSERLQARYWLFEEADHPVNRRAGDEKPKRDVKGR